MKGIVKILIASLLVGSVLALSGCGFLGHGHYGSGHRYGYTQTTGSTAASQAGYGHYPGYQHTGY